MESKDDRGFLWLHLICCGGPLLVVLLITLVPLLVSFVQTYRLWVLVVGIGVVFGTALIWRRRRRCAPRLNPSDYRNEFQEQTG